MNEVTQILSAIVAGNRPASDELLPIAYEELRQLAAARLSGEGPGQTLQPTALVHEAYLRLVGQQDCTWENRGHFFAAAAESMRRIMVDRARQKRRLKRGGDRRRVDLQDVHMAFDMPPGELVALDEALTKLGLESPARAKLVKLRFFAGLTSDQAARAMGISKATADRHWSFARAWLFHELTKDDASGAETSPAG